MMFYCDSVCGSGCMGFGNNKLVSSRTGWVKVDVMIESSDRTQAEFTVLFSV